MPKISKGRLDELERQIVGPKRVGLFGHRAVGKTTLLAMFYREASTGRVPLVRLAAGDARTAEYLGDRIAQIESGEPPAGTLSETALHLKLYHGMTRLDLHVRDYQGEHVALGAEAPIRDFFQDCDALFLCLDGEAADRAPERQRRQQEIEQLLEQYFEQSEHARAERPLAVLITKYDRVIERGGPAPEHVERVVETCFGMTRHALERHVPDAAVFAVSSYGRGVDASNRPPASLEPLGLDAPLAWLAHRLEAVDRERLEWLFDVAPRDLARLGRCLKVFERRYPRSSASIDFRRRLGSLKRRRLGRVLLQTAGLGCALVLGLVGYDAWGYHDALKFETAARSPAEIEAHWSRLVLQHPSMRFVFPDKLRDAQEKQMAWRLKAAQARLEGGDADVEILKDLPRMRTQAPTLAAQIDEVRRTEANLRQEQAWKRLEVADLVAIEDPDRHLNATRQYLRDFPDTPHRAEAVTLVAGLEKLRDARMTRNDRQVIDGLSRASSLPGAVPSDLIEEAQQFLSQRSDSPYRGEVEALLADLVDRADLADIQKARQFSKAHPENFDARRARYLEYLKSHSEGGGYIAEANAEIERIDRAREAQLYRLAYDHYAAHPDDVPAIAERLRAYVDANPGGRHAEIARKYLAWWERISSPSDYRVVLRRGRVEANVGKFMAGSGPDLGVTLWVAGVEYGPSPVIKDSRTPIWDHTFDTPIRWKYGDPISVRIIDHDWSASGVFTLTSRAGDKLAMRLLSGTLRPAKGGKTELVFASDFDEPHLPAPE